MRPSHPTVFLVDVDNTLLDNDAIQQDLKDHIERVYGRAARDRYWRILEDLFTELGYRDYIGALQRYRVEHPREVELLSMSSFLLDYPFAERLYPACAGGARSGSRDLGPTVILSDGDVVFQPRKVDACGHRRCGRWTRADLSSTRKRHWTTSSGATPPNTTFSSTTSCASSTAVKKAWGERVTTVFARQGSYAHDPSCGRRLAGRRRDDRTHRRPARL